MALLLSLVPVCPCSRFPSLPHECAGLCCAFQFITRAAILRSVCAEPGCQSAGWKGDELLNQAIQGVDVPGGSEVKASACNAGDLGLIPGSERSPGEGNGTPRQ